MEFFPLKLESYDICLQVEWRTLSGVFSGEDKKLTWACSMVTCIWVSHESLFPLSGDFKALLQQTLWSGTCQPYLSLQLSHSDPVLLVHSLGTHCLAFSLFWIHTYISNSSLSFPMGLLSDPLWPSVTEDFILSQFVLCFLANFGQPWWYYPNTYFRWKSTHLFFAGFSLPVTLIRNVIRWWLLFLGSSQAYTNL